MRERLSANSTGIATMDIERPRPRRRFAILARALSIVGLLAVFAAAPAPAQEDVSAETYRLRGASVAVHNLAGRVEVVRGEGDAVRVEVTRRGRDAARLSVATGVLDGRQTLRVIYPEDRIVYAEGSDDEDDVPALLRWLGVGFESEIEVGDDGRIGDGDREVEVVSSGDGLHAWADLRVHVPAGGQLAVRSGVGAVRLTDVEATADVRVHSGPVEANGVRGPLTVDTGSGSVRASSVSGDLDVDTGSGGVDVEDVSGARVSVSTGSGSVAGSDLRGESVRVETGSGGVELDRVSIRALTVETGSGSVAVGLISDLERGEIDTGSGGVEVRVPPDFGARLDLETGSGGIDVEVPARRIRADDDGWTGEVGDGRGRLEVETGSGSIAVVRG